MKHLRKRKLFAVLLLCMVLLMAFSATALAESDTTAGAYLADTEAAAVVAEGEEEEYQSNMFATFWALVPPIVAIVLALITKEVYLSLFLGILTGALFYANFDPVMTVTSIFDTLIAKVGDTWNAGILLFLIILGIMVVLMARAGGSGAYGKWAGRKIKSKRGALLSTGGLGILIFVDDYFNCLTVGSVMRPVTDKFNISRAKLAYIVDSTAAPICIIAPISSWAAAVTSCTEGTNIDGFRMFLQAIPYNLYAILTIVMVFAIIIMKVDFGPMRKHELNAEAGDLYTTDSRPYEGVDEGPVSDKGKVLDLVLPVIALIVFCIIGMIYTGGFFEGESFIDAFANCDASAGLVLGSFLALVFTFLLYIPRRVLSLKQFAACLPEGFKAMVPAIMILAFAWTLAGFCRDGLGAGEFVGAMVEGSAAANIILPAVMFAIALGLAFATGTSWGTFGILIPIVIAIFPEMSEILVISISACLAGAVCGDHISPISDTTIMASTGAQCDHINHVSTQLPYALMVAVISFCGFILAGIIQNPFIVLAICIVVLLAILFGIKKHNEKKAPAAPTPAPTAE